MKNTYFGAILAALAFTAGSCVAGGEQPQNETPLRLTSDVKAHSRAFAHSVDTQIDEGEKVAVWVDPTAGGTPLYQWNVLTADGNGAFAGNDMFFPQGSNVDIYALHPADRIKTAEWPTAALTHSVRFSQTNIEDYAYSDLLYAVSKDVAPTLGDVPLTFHHLMAKLRVAIVLEDGLTPADFADVDFGVIVWAKSIGTFTLDKNTAPEDVVVTASNDGAIDIGKDISPDFTPANVVYNDAIVVPQTVPAGSTFLSIGKMNVGLLDCVLPNDFTMESGKVYTMHVTVTSEGMSVRNLTDVDNWEAGGSVPGYE